jgi:hypothetical protein
MAAMDDLRRLEAKGLVRARARSRRRRTSIIRSRTIRGSLGLFAILWAIIFVQLVTGNDPVLGRSGGGHARATAAQESRTSGTREPEAAAPATAPPEPESALEAERQLEAELAAERESEWEPEWEAEPAPEPVVPIITSSS